MAGDISDRLLENPDEGGQKVRICRQNLQVISQPGLNPRPLPKGFQLPLDRRLQSELIEERRPQVGGDIARRLDRSLHRRNQLWHFRPPGIRGAFQRAKLELQSREGLPEIIVDLSRNSRPLRLEFLLQAGRQAPQPRSLQGTLLMR